ncbi:hypothetical protein O6H91_02G038800 [Diphasiastrum complanatum]|uniref:Uncharacterized protein n=1 Tax=Diphasiastrum complanatum TaxID=34168 RepID=A0ACC2EEI4_DIPCM|nr:hypothetical protein O6H91_02G038800 [Diphasiastrum complanatum]
MEPLDEVVVFKEVPAATLKDSKHKLQESMEYREPKRLKVEHIESKRIVSTEDFRVGKQIDEMAAVFVKREPENDHSIVNACSSNLGAADSSEHCDINQSLRLGCTLRLDLDLNAVWHEDEDLDNESNPNLPLEESNNTRQFSEIAITNLANDSLHIAEDGTVSQKEVWTSEATLKHIEATQVVKSIHRPLKGRLEGPADFPGAVGKGDLIKECYCCKKPEGRRNTLICDGCEGSFHLACSKLRHSAAVELQDWMCSACATKGNNRRWPLGKIGRTYETKETNSISNKEVRANHIGNINAGTGTEDILLGLRKTNWMNTQQLHLHGSTGSSIIVNAAQKLGTSLVGVIENDWPCQEIHQKDLKEGSQRVQGQISLSFGPKKFGFNETSISRCESPVEISKETEILKSSSENLEDPKICLLTGAENNLAITGTNVSNLERHSLYVEIGGDAQTIEHSENQDRIIHVGEIKAFFESSADKFEKADMDFANTDEELKRLEHNAMQSLKAFIQEKQGCLGEGWRVEVKRRKKEPNSIVDKIFYSPDKQKFRSRVEVARFLGLLDSKTDKMDGSVFETEAILVDQDQQLKPGYVVVVEGSGKQLLMDGGPNHLPAGGTDCVINQASKHAQHVRYCGKQNGGRKRKTHSLRDRFRWHQRACKATEGFRPPFLFADMMIESLGAADSRSSYHDETHIWPVGYRVTWHSPQFCSFFIGEVLEGGMSGPIFRITRRSCCTVPHHMDNQVDLHVPNLTASSTAEANEEERERMSVRIDGTEAGVCGQHVDDSLIVEELHIKDGVTVVPEPTNSCSRQAANGMSQYYNEDDLQVLILLGDLVSEEKSNFSFNETVCQSNTAKSTIIPCTATPEMDNKILITEDLDVRTSHADGFTVTIGTNRTAGDMLCNTSLMTEVPLEQGDGRIRLSVLTEGMGCEQSNVQAEYAGRDSKQKMSVDENNPNTCTNSRAYGLDSDAILDKDLTVLAIHNQSDSETVNILQDPCLLYSVFEVVAEGSSPDEAWMKLTRQLVENCEGSFDMSKQFQIMCPQAKVLSGVAVPSTKVKQAIESPTDQNETAFIEKYQQLKHSDQSVEGGSNCEARRAFLINMLGNHHFDLDDPLVQSLIEALPGTEHCINYKFLGQRGLDIGKEKVVDGLSTCKSLVSADECGKKRVYSNFLTANDVDMEAAKKLKRDLLEKENRSPPPTGQLIGNKFPPELVGDLIEVFEFVCRFAEVLGLEQPPVLEDLEEAFLNPFLAEECKSQLEPQTRSFDRTTSSIEAQVPSDVTQEGGSALIATIHIHLLKLLLADFQNKYTIFFEMDGELEDPKPKKGRPKNSERSPGCKVKGSSLPLNLITWPEVARRYMNAVLADQRNGPSMDIGYQERFKFLRCLQGDGGILCGAITGLSGADADAQFLAEAERTLSGKPAGSVSRDILGSGALKTEDTEKSVMDKSENKNSETWFSILEPVAKLPTNVGSRIKNRVLEALAAGAPDWAKEVLERSIQKDVYKSNAAGQTKNAVLSVLEKFHGKEMVPKRRRKSMKKPSSSPDFLMRRCRLVLRHVLSLDQCQAFLSFLQGTIPGSFINDGENSEKAVQLVARPLDFRTVDLRLAAGAYGESHEAFAADVRQIWRNVHLVYPSGSEAVELANFLSGVFESLYTEQVVNMAHEPEDGNLHAARLQKPVGEKRVSSSKDIVKVSAEAGSEETVNPSHAMELFHAQVKDQSAGMNGEFPKAPWEEEGVCKVCGIDEDDDHVLLCDACDAEYHIYCLTPQLTKIPEGNWYCPSCVGVGKALLEAVPPVESNNLNTEKVLEEKVPEKKDSTLQSHVFDALRHMADKLEKKDYWQLCVADCADIVSELQQKLRTLTVERRNCVTLSSFSPHGSSNGSKMTAITSHMADSGNRDVHEEKVGMSSDSVPFETMVLGRNSGYDHAVLNLKPTSNHAKLGNANPLMISQRWALTSEAGNSFSRSNNVKDNSLHTLQILDNQNEQIFSCETPISVDGQVFSSGERGKAGISEGQNLGQCISTNLNLKGLAGGEERQLATALESTLNEGISLRRVEQKTGIYLEQHTNLEIMNHEPKLVFDDPLVAKLDLVAPPDENAFISNLDKLASQKHVESSCVRDANVTRMMKTTETQECRIPENKSVHQYADTAKKALVNAHDKGLIHMGKSQEEEGLRDMLIQGNIFTSAVSSKNSIAVLDKEICRIQRRLLDACPRRELMGRDEFGRLYWALSLPNKRDWLVVQEKEADFPGQRGVEVINEAARITNQDSNQLNEPHMGGTFAFDKATSLGTQIIKTSTLQRNEDLGKADVESSTNGLDDKTRNFRWLSYHNHEDIDKLFTWFTSSSQQEKELKATLLQWRYLSRTLAAPSIMEGNHRSQLSDGEPAMLKKRQTKHSSDETGDVFLLSKARKVLQIRSVTPQAIEIPEESQSLKKRGRKIKEKCKGDQTLSRCDCLEPLYPLRYHCQSCHETYDSVQELETHKEGQCLQVSFSKLDKRPKESSCFTNEKRSGPPGKGAPVVHLNNAVPGPLRGHPSQRLLKEKAQECTLEEQFRDKEKHPLVEREAKKGSLSSSKRILPEIPDLSLVSVMFTSSETIRDRILQIGCIADKGPTFAPALSYAPFFDPMHKITSSHLEKADLSSEPFVSTRRACGNESFGLGKTGECTMGSSIKFLGTYSTSEYARDLTGSLHSYTERERDLRDGPGKPHGHSAPSEVHSLPDKERSVAELGELGNKKNSVPTAVFLPLHGNNRFILKKLQSMLLDIEAALTNNSLEPARSLSSRRRAWRSLVKAATSIYEMVEAVVLLEQMIKGDQLRPFWGLWCSISASLKTSTMSALALRLYTLDWAIIYDVTCGDDETKALDSTQPKKKGKKKAKVDDV